MISSEARSRIEKYGKATLEIRQKGIPFNVRLFVPIVNPFVEKQMLFKAKQGEVKVKEASFKTDGKDGTLLYTTVAGDLDVPGDWGMQIALVMPAGTLVSASPQAVSSCAWVRRCRK